MKMSIPSLTVALLPLLPLLTTNTAAQSVLDSDGNEVRAGAPYYVGGINWGAGHGGVMAWTTNNADACEYNVQFIGTETKYTTECDSFPDMPISFSPMGPSFFNRIEVNAPFQISFPSLGRHCVRNSNTWVVEEDGRLRTSRTDESPPRNQWFQMNRQPCYGRRCPSVYTLSNCKTDCTTWPVCPRSAFPTCRYLSMMNNGGQEFTDDQSRATELSLHPVLILDSED